MIKFEEQRMEDEGCVKQILKYKPKGRRHTESGSKQMARSIEGI
jgi:hypothetical protein